MSDDEKTPEFKLDQRRFEYYREFPDLHGVEVVVKESSSAKGLHCWIFHGGEIRRAAHLNVEMVHSVLDTLDQFLETGTGYHALREDHGALISFSSEHRSETYETLLHVHYEDGLWFTLNQDGTRELARGLAAFITRVSTRWNDGEKYLKED